MFYGVMHTSIENDHHMYKNANNSEHQGNYMIYTMLSPSNKLRND